MKVTVYRSLYRITHPPLAVQAQGTIRGAQEGAAQGEQAAGSVGAVVSGAVGAVTGTVKGYCRRCLRSDMRLAQKSR